jgi:xylulokinase
MEGVVLALRDGLEIMQELGVDAKAVRAIGGGATSDLWLQLQADVYRAPVERLAVEEGAAYGAALLGHVTAGTFAGVDEATSVVRILPEVTEPDPAHAAVYQDVYDVFRSLYGTLRDDMHRLSDLAG